MNEPDQSAILIVDDEPKNLVALVALLADAGTRLVVANSGEEALRRVLEEDFAMILLDVQMPGMDGFETAELIRTRERSRKTPIVFQTAWATEPNRVARGYAIGAVDYVAKPIDPAVLRSKVAVFLDLQRKTQALERKNVELEIALQQTARANQFKSWFLASVSHELRTPLGGILGFAELLEDGSSGPLNALQREHAGQVLRNAEHLAALVDDLLDLSKIEAGRMELAPRWTSLGSIVDSVVNGLQTVAAKAVVEIALDIPDGFPELNVDPLRMRQVLFNLLSNAIKFSPESSLVTIHGKIDAKGVAISVEDHGIGIPSDQVNRLFREFEQVQLPNGSNRPIGTGLGLSVTRHLVELHDGTIDVDTAPGRGSLFTVRLPARRARLTEPVH